MTTLQGEELTVRIDGDAVFINDARVTTADLDANNGVVHVIDSVLVPSAVANSALLADTGIIGNEGQVAQYATLAGLFLIGSTFAVVGYKKLNQ